MLKPDGLSFFTDVFDLKKRIGVEFLDFAWDENVGVRSLLEVGVFGCSGFLFVHEVILDMIPLLPRLD